MKRNRSLVFWAGLLAAFTSVAAMKAAARADEATVPPPTICPVAVVAVLAVPGTPPRTTYAAILASPLGPGRASGTLWVNTKDGAFGVHFAGRGVTIAPFTNAVDPIVFTLPESEPLENVFVSELDDPQPGPCQIYNTWVPGLTSNLRDDLRDRFGRAISAAPEPIAALPIADPDSACRSGNAPPATAIAVAPANSPVDAPGRVFVRVRLAADSSVLDAKIERSEVAFHNHDALQATRASVFITETRACRPQVADYTFIVIFQ